MAKIIKFVYIMILCVSLLLIVEAGGKECVTDVDCEKIYPGNKKPLICSTGYCYSLYEEPPRYHK
ncbi:putative Late nodulin [Medicago truncatula]|uniref:Late nodulin n=1 Tax=Medicago truncatula TaxID=3880 RepID=A7KHB8_MEDTR|nr:nodule-specific cysteine-rich peptide 201 [Medicago truncatula]AES88958.1 late nodulin [Medicago truncatula]RHN61073.1 putative Late nodulin [Medicago truncatula]